MRAFVTRTRGVDADELEELVMAAQRAVKFYWSPHFSLGLPSKPIQELAAALKPFEKEQGR